jgi:peroxin-14
VDESFDKAFALLEQLATDTQELKEAEASRKQRLDAALADVESVISRMKQANEEREMESKRVAREISEIRDQIPKAIEKEKEATDNRLKELGTEMKSLKTLVANRMQGGGVPPPRAIPSFPATQSTATGGHVLGNGAPVNGVSAAAPAQETAPETNGVNGSTIDYKPPYSAGSPRDSAATPYSRLLGGKAAIPSWQLAAKKKAEEAKGDGASTSSVTPAQTVNDSGTASEAVEGQS